VVSRRLKAGYELTSIGAWRVKDDPYEILGVPPAADEGEIRGRYLDLVRQFPPDRAPERFTQVREAYEALRDPVTRLKRQLFDTRNTDTVDALRIEVIRQLRAARLPTKKLLALAEAK
jgi:hypothetical protein